jgi:hypothetical protein
MRCLEICVPVVNYQKHLPEYMELYPVVGIGIIVLELRLQTRS